MNHQLQQPNHITRCKWYNKHKTYSQNNIGKRDTLIFYHTHNSELRAVRAYVYHLNNKYRNKLLGHQLQS